MNKDDIKRLDDYVSKEKDVDIEMVSQYINELTAPFTLFLKRLQKDGVPNETIEQLLAGNVVVGLLALNPNIDEALFSLKRVHESAHKSLAMTDRILNKVK